MLSCGSTASLNHKRTCPGGTRSTASCAGSERTNTACAELLPGKASSKQQASSKAMQSLVIPCVCIQEDQCGRVFIEHASVSCFLAEAVFLPRYHLSSALLDYRWWRYYRSRVLDDFV